MLRQRFELAVRAGLGRCFISDVKRGKMLALECDGWLFVKAGGQSWVADTAPCS